MIGTRDILSAIGMSEVIAMIETHVMAARVVGAAGIRLNHRAKDWRLVSAPL